ncbi:unnamed protein product [Schistosoma turkestanicum]|nr:unnamed protein product [Schistosoma turkestanicum]
MENVDPISNANNHNNNNDQIKSTCCYSKKLKRKNLKISKSICYRNKLRNTVNSNSNNSTTTATTTTTTAPTQNEILCNGITSNLNDSIESKQWDCVPTSRHDLNLPTTDTEYFSDKDNPPGKHDLHINVTGRNRNTLTTQLSMENEKRLTIDSTNPTKQTHHSLKHNNHFSSNNLSESHCNEGINSPFASLENHESIVMNGDLTLCELHNDKLTDNDELCDKSNAHCNNFEENCEATQVLNSNLHNPLNQNNEQCTTTPLQNSQHKFKLESNLLEKTSYKTDHLTGKTNHHASPMIQPNDSKPSDCGVNTVLFGEDSSSTSTTTTTTTTQYGSSTSDDIGWAIVQRQRELRLLCTANHRMLRRLIQAARRDMQRQEILRRLAIADADVIEAYNKLESYRPYRKPPLKRDRDLSWKALKERRKILKELEAFDAKSP